MKRSLRRAVSLLCVLAMCLSLLPTTALAAWGDGGYDSGSYGDPGEESSGLKPADKHYSFNGQEGGNDIILSKTAKDNRDGTYIVTLSATADEIITAKPTEVVFVIDGSGSMNWCKDNADGEGNTGYIGPEWQEHYHGNWYGAYCTYVQEGYRDSRWDIALNAIDTMMDNLGDEGISYKFVVFKERSGHGPNATTYDRLDQVKNISPSGGTYLSDGVEEALDAFEMDGANRVMIIVADGDSNDGYPDDELRWFDGEVFTVGFTFSNDDFEDLASDNDNAFYATDADELEVSMEKISENIKGLISDPLGPNVSLVGDVDVDYEGHGDGSLWVTGDTINWTRSGGLDGTVTLTYTVKIDESQIQAGRNEFPLNDGATLNYQYDSQYGEVSHVVAFPEPVAVFDAATLKVSYVDEEGDPVNVRDPIKDEWVKIEDGAYFNAEFPEVGDEIEGKNGTIYYVEEVRNLPGDPLEAEAYEVTIVLSDKKPLHDGNPIAIQVVVDDVEPAVTGGDIDRYIDVTANSKNGDSYENGMITFDYLSYNCADIPSIAADEGYVIEAIRADLVYGGSGSNGIKADGDGYSLDNVQGDSIVTVYVRTVYTAQFHDTTGAVMREKTETDLVSGTAADLEDNTSYVDKDFPANPEEENGYSKPDNANKEQDGRADSDGMQPGETITMVVSGLQTTVTMPALPTVEENHTASGWWLNDSSCSGEPDYKVDDVYTVNAANADDDHIIHFYSKSSVDTGSYAVVYEFLDENGSEDTTVTTDDNGWVEGTTFPGGGSANVGEEVSVTPSNAVTRTESDKYVLVSTNHSCTITKDGPNTITVTYALDNWKDDEDGDSETGGDGIPDYKQALIRYVVDGTGGSVSPAIQVETLTETDGSYSKEVIASSVATANADYAFDYWTWTDNGTSETSWTASLSDEFTAQGGQTYTYTAHFAEDNQGNLEGGEETGDGTPDKYQAFVWFKSANDAEGTVTTKASATDNTGIYQVFTFENHAISGSVTPTLAGVDVAAKDNFAFDIWTKDAVATGSDTGIDPTETMTDVAGGTTITFYANFAEDKIGEETPGEGDGIPDKYQARVTYRIVGGTWSGGSTEIFQVYTFQKFDENTQTWKPVDPAPTLDNIPNTSAVIPDASHIKAGTWGDNTPEAGSSLEAGKAYIYTYTLTATAPAVSVTKTADEESVKVGETITYTIEVTNSGNTDLTDVVVTDTFTGKGALNTSSLPADVTYANGSFTIADLDRTDVVTITVTYVATEADIGTITNTAASQLDGNKDDDTVTTTVTEADAPGLSVTKSVDKPAARVGDTLTYTIRVENTGNVDLTDVTVTDTFNGAGTLEFADGTNVTNNDGTYTITISRLPCADGNDVVTITATYTVTAGDMGEIITNSVIAKDGEGGPEDDDTTTTTVEDGDYTVTIQPADITIYTGGETYGGVTDANGNIVVKEDGGLPEPGYHIDLSEDIVAWLRENGVVVSGGDNAAANLENILSFEYRDENGEVIRRWTLEYAGIYDVNEETGEPTRYVYRLVTKVGAYDVRLQYRDGNEYRFNDDIEMDADTVSAQYEMSIYGGGLDQSQIVAVLSAGDDTQECTTIPGTGTLTIRSTTDEEYFNEIAADETDVDRNAITAVENGSVTYYVNDSEVKVDADRVQLLVDEVSNNAGFNLEMARDAMGHAIDSSATDWTNRSDLSYEMAYMDLVDIDNGNAMVTMGESDSLTIYWPMPDDADPYGDFHVVHYTGMDRENTMDESGLDNAAKEILTGEAVPIDGRWYVAFDADSFSPFVLVYEEEDNDRPSRPRPDPDDDKDDEDEEPEEDLSGLNTTDHYAYIAGYEDGTVRPDGNITRAEVATIFFRLMTDEYRETCWSTSSGFTDVTAANWYNNAISTTANAGWVSGYPDGTFRPDAYITRAEFATIAARFLSDVYGGTSMFTDISGHWAEDYINRAATAGWINGYADGTFRPNAYITRAEAVTLINRMLDRAPDANHLLADMVRWPDNPETAWYYADIQEATNSHDYTRAGTGNYEVWTELLANRDWAALEEIWSQANDAPGGEVADGLTPNGN